MGEKFAPHVDFTSSPGTLSPLQPRMPRPPERDSQGNASSPDRAPPRVRLTDPTGRQAPARIDRRAAGFVLLAADHRRLPWLVHCRPVVADDRPGAPGL